MQMGNLSHFLGPASPKSPHFVDGETEKDSPAVWLSWVSAVPGTRRSPVPFKVRAHA